MRTRRQDKAVAEAAAAAATADAPETTTTAAASIAAEEEKEEVPSSEVASPITRSDDKNAQASPTTTVTISKIEAPAVKRSDSKPRSKLPTPVQFPLVAILSLAIAELGYSLSWPLTQGVLTTHARLLGTWAEVGAVTGWKLFELALGWFGDYDGYDITALNLLSQGPHLYLLYAHYETPAFALLVTVVVETLATYIPFRLLRPLSRAHANPTAVPNADILADVPITLLTTLLSGVIYSVSLLFAYATYLPNYLVLYFAGLPSIVRANESSYVGLLPVALALGFAARVFIFTPAEATGRTPEDAENEAFDPVKASLRETVRWNFLGWSSQTKVAMKRTALIMLVSGVNTFLRTWLTIVGVETAGAAAWSSIWVIAAGISGLALSAVGGV
ncbi:hypothetical protein F5B22DRAFT_583509 [Xylaria bambusicola]|uniref:uncharacterized protein n=1 Tax=Xylaria bambusicola TaxID=326684 RepID=UPI002008B800|nr:uncharacterized protein F5B22DRAFT_583509 [Xylaria bambusicola]KAI0528075.1 hypothetical protein F5B22DRAFT_583509 [Xylaria bambusicola]